MKMSKVHFQALAQALHKAKIEGHGLNSASTKYVNEQWELCMRNIASVCAASNIFFDRNKFYYICKNGV